MKIVFLVFIILFIVFCILGLTFKNPRIEKRRRVKFEDLSPKQKRYVLKRIKEKQRKENK